MNNFQTANRIINQLTNVKPSNKRNTMKTTINVFDILEAKYPKEFKKVYKKLSNQMFYNEAEILLEILEGRRDFGDPMGNNARWANNFMQWLGIKN